MDWVNLKSKTRKYVLSNTFSSLDKRTKGNNFEKYIEYIESVKICVISLCSSLEFIVLVDSRQTID